MTDEEKKAKAKEYILRQIEDIEWYQVAESLDYDVPDSVAGELFELIHSAKIEITFP